ncbi:MAG: radical SAM protein [Oscillospiraceae bacterium]|nr:radical SAM protein [Oscillospiraceae bacterium]
MATAERTAPVVATSRIRMQTDGKGVTTLVCFHGCPLRCKWCINPFSFDPNTKYTAMTPQALYDQVKLDELYFLATGGGVTFGGGEPLLYPDFLQEFRGICGDEWHLCAETSLAVPWENVEKAAGCIDVFYIDCKDTNPDIYRRYTGRDNALMLDNLQKLVGLVGKDRIVVRLPLIPEFNTDEDRQRSKELLSAMGITNFDLFTYRTSHIKK